MIRDLYDLPPATFGKRIGLRIKGQHLRMEELLDFAVAAYWLRRKERRHAA